MQIPQDALLCYILRATLLDLLLNLKPSLSFRNLHSRARRRSIQHSFLDLGARRTSIDEQYRRYLFSSMRMGETIKRIPRFRSTDRRRQTTNWDIGTGSQLHGLSRNIDFLPHH